MEFHKYVENGNRSILTAIRAGMNPMQSAYWETPAGRIPSFPTYAAPDPQNPEHTSPGNHMSPGASAHLAGRWLDALLNAQAVTGETVDEEMISSLRRITFDTLTKGVYGLPCGHDENYRVSRTVDSHSMRESMHALAALVKYRDDQEALQLAEAQIDAFSRFFDFDRACWREDLMEEAGGRFNTLTGPVLHFAEYAGRYIGPLVKLYRATGMEKALHLALRLKDVCFRYVLKEDGHFDPELFSPHLHSATSMVSSLALLGETTRDWSILDRVQAFLGHGLLTFAFDFGWCSENFRRYDLIGEINNTIDILESCLVLARMGRGEYYGQAERIIRGHVLPSQVLDTHFIPRFDDPDDPATWRLPEKLYGSFGFPTPYGHEYRPGHEISFNMDIVGGGLSGLCAAWRSCVSQENGLLSVNLLFDYEDSRVKVSSPYPEGLLTVVPKKDCTLRVRRMGNLLPEALELSHSDCCESGGWLYFYGVKAGEAVTIRFPMAEKEVDYHYRYESFRFRWRGEEVVAASSEGKRLCYFQENAEASRTAG